MWYSTKTYGHEVGISCAFRQWRAVHSHCQYLHGYALSFKFVFEAEELDSKNWVADFGGLKELKQYLVDTFDHKTVVAVDDPLMTYFEEVQDQGGLELTVLPAVGCEKFAEHAYNKAAEIIRNRYGAQVRVTSCEVSEHGANSALYAPNRKDHTQD